MREWKRDTHKHTHTLLTAFYEWWMHSGCRLLIFPLAEASCDIRCKSHAKPSTAKHIPKSVPIQALKRTQKIEYYVRGAIAYNTHALNALQSYGFKSIKKHILRYNFHFHFSLTIQLCLWIVTAFALTRLRFCNNLAEERNEKCFFFFLRASKI